MKKSDIIKALETLPEDGVSIDDVVGVLVSAKRANRPYSPALEKSIMEGIKAMEEGRTIPNEGLYEKDMKWLDSL